MKYILQELIDIEQFQSLQDKLNEIYSFPSAIIDNEGNILTATAWQDVCTKFHRVHPESEKECRISDQYIVDHIHEAHPAVSYKCPHGLVDNATPIIIDGIHYGNFFTGQFFLEPPDLDFFKAQAGKYGFDEKEYLVAIRKVPVWTNEQLTSYLFFIKGLIEVISGIGLKSLKEKETRESLKKSEALYHDLVETAQDLIWQCDSEGRYTYLNPAWEEVFGYTVEEMLGKKFTDFQTPEWAERDLQEFARLMHGNTVKGLETVHIAKDGREINLIFNAKYARDINGQVIGTNGTAFNVTGYRKTQKALSESEVQYRLLINSMAEGVVLHEVIYDNRHMAIDYRIVDSNPSFERETGIKASMAKNQLGSKLYGAAEAPFLDIYAKVAETGNPTHFETYFSPLEKHFDVSVFSHKRGWFATIFTDITERKRAEIQLQKSNEVIQAQNEEFQQLNEELSQMNDALILSKEKAEESDRLKSAFLANMSHEIRTPLNSIIGFSELLAIEDTEKEEVIRYSSIIHSSGNRLLELINLLIDISKIESGTDPVRYSPVRPAGIMHEVADGFRLMASEKCVKMLLSVPPEIQDFSFQSDSLKIHQVLSNLVSNALKFNPGGTVEMGMNLHPEGILFYVRDLGIGIPADKLSKVFDRFYQVESDHLPRSQGAGLGLSLCRSMVELLGGRIWVKSKVGKGSTFSFILPYFKSKP